MKQSTLNPRFLIVNPLWLLVFLLFFGGCGFQLNRNLISLPAGAKTLALAKVKNHSFTPSLDLTLTQQLNEAFSRQNLPLRAESAADVVLEIEIKGFSVNRVDLSLGRNDSFQYNYNIEAWLTLRDNRNKKNLFEKESLSGRSNRQTTRTELNDAEQAEDRARAVEDLVKAITTKLTQNF